MRILYLLRYYPTLTETFVYTEIQGLLEAGITVEIAALGARLDGRIQDELPGCPVHFIPRSPARYFRRASSTGQLWIQNYQRRKDAQRLHDLKKIAAGFDHIHVHFAGEAAEIAHALWLDDGIPYSVTTHAVDIFRPRPSWIEVLQSAHSVITISEYNQRYLQEHGISSQVIRCGIELDRWPEIALPRGPLRGLFIGRSVPKKGLPLLLQAAQRLSGEQQLTVVTDRALPSTNNLQTLGFQSRAQIRALIRQCNLLIAPCVVADDGDRDGIPVVMMEALASGRPVLSTDISGIPELITPEVGKLIASNDIEALTISLHTIDEEIRSCWSMQARKRIIDFGGCHRQSTKMLLEHLEICQ